MMTERYKAEFEKNADWLHLAFHSMTEFPDRPYEQTEYNRLRCDYDRMLTQIRRFAGDAVIEPATTIHWGAANSAGVRAIRARGIQTLMGYMQVVDGEPHVSYHMTPEQIALVNEYGFWKDPEEDMIYGKIQCVMNIGKREHVIETLEQGKRDNPRRSTLELMIHEQYFHPFYQSYEPDFRERVLDGCRWCVENGYRPVFASEQVQEP